MTLDETLKELRRLGNRADREMQARFGVDTATSLGIRVPALRALAKKIGTNHKLAQSLWRSGIHEGRLLATMIDDPALVTEKQMERWSRDFASWDVVDSACGNLFDKTEFAYKKAFEWSEREEEFVKRAGFSLMAYIAVHDKRAPDARIAKFLPLIEREAEDPRNFVKKAVNWALRQIGKRSLLLRRSALEVAERIARSGSPAARWVARDAIRELESEAVGHRLKSKPVESKGSAR